MPVALAPLAIRAGTVVAQYAPAVYDKAKSYLAAATSGKVAAPTAQALAAYVGNSQQRLTVVGDALIRSGMSVNDVFPKDLIGSDQALMALRASAEKLAVSLRGQFDAGADKVVSGQSGDMIVADVIRVKRVKAVLSVYGSADNYFLCHPNGGVPAGDFAYVRAMRAAM